jgi:hypothetical protein
MSQFGRWIWRKRFATAGQMTLLETRLDELSRQLKDGGRENSARLTGLEHAVAHTSEAVGDVRRAISEVVTELTQMLTELTQMLTELYANEAGDRRALAAVRDDSEYDRAYSEDTPLVTVIIPTQSNWVDLGDRAVPSVLAQSYQHLEILVVGDDAPQETSEVLAKFSDHRIRFLNLPMRGPYPEDAAVRWLVSGVAPYDAGLRAARGLWVCPFADDDALRPNAIESVLGAARSERHELCYGLLDTHWPTIDGVRPTTPGDHHVGGRQVLGEFPPRLGGNGLQGSIYHAGLRIFEQLLGGHAFGLPNDWLMLRRMLYAGVRVGFLDEIVADYYPGPGRFATGTSAGRSPHARNR